MDHVRWVPDTHIRVGVGQSSDIGTIDLDIRRRDRTSPTEGEIGRQRPEHIGPRKVGPRITQLSVENVR